MWTRFMEDGKDVEDVIPLLNTERERGPKEVST